MPRVPGPGGTRERAGERRSGIPRGGGRKNTTGATGGAKGRDTGTQMLRPPSDPEGATRTGRSHDGPRTHIRQAAGRRQSARAAPARRGFMIRPRTSNGPIQDVRAARAALAAGKNEKTGRNG